MSIPDHRIPEDMNFADYCDALRNEGYRRFTQSARRAQKPQLPGDIKPHEKHSVDERSQAGP